MAATSPPANTVDLDPRGIRPSDTCIRIGEIVAAGILRQQGNPKEVRVTAEQLALICAYAAQATINGIKGEWQ